MRGGLGVLLKDIVAGARAQGRRALLEPEGLTIASALGIGVPEHVMIAGAKEIPALDLGQFHADRIVVKVISPDILHRSDVGGVAVVPKGTEPLVEQVAGMQRRFLGMNVAGYMLASWVPHDPSPGGELLLGARWTDDFGPIVTVGAGGVHAEHLAASLRPGRDVAILSPGMIPREGIEEALQEAAIVPMATGRLRGPKARFGSVQLDRIVSRLLDFAAAAMPHDLTDFEINPLVAGPDGPMALDVLAKVGTGPRHATPPRPLEKVPLLLRPSSIGIIGVSEKLNPGRLIVQNLIRSGFDRARIHIVKPGVESIEGCRCVPDVSSLPGRMDLFIISIEAARVPALMQEIVSLRKAESVILIPGGFAELSGGRPLESAMREALEASRATAWRGPIVNGGNCLGIRSRPGRYDTMFIPPYKLPHSDAPESPLAVISQSGAFALAAASNLPVINPRYLISLGNQMDLTAGDYLTALSEEKDLEVFACYVEGFAPLDGRRFLEAAGKLGEAGRTVILYRAGRTPAGARASASHTAAVAGDYAVTRALCRARGVVVAETLDEFARLTALFCQLRDRPVSGWRLGAMSNAGFECVAMGDWQGQFRIEPFSPATVRRLRALLEKRRLHQIVDVRNPFDMTPMLDDAAWEESIRAIMDDPRVDVGIIGCVPLSGAITTLAAGPGHGEDIRDERSIVRCMTRLREEIVKPWVVVVDSGRPYDPMAGMLMAAGIPVFRHTDTAMRLMEIFCRRRLGVPSERDAAA